MELQRKTMSDLVERMESLSVYLSAAAEGARALKQIQIDPVVQRLKLLALIEDVLSAHNILVGKETGDE